MSGSVAVKASTGWLAKHLELQMKLNKWRAGSIWNKVVPKTHLTKVHTRI